MDAKIQSLIIGLVIGVLVTLLISNYSVNSQNYGMTNDDHGDEMMAVMHGDESMSIASMLERLEDLQGDDFDEEFVRLMIEHHQGAIDMTELIASRSQKEELRTMGEDIINVQSAEISLMQGWLDKWSEK